MGIKTNRHTTMKTWQFSQRNIVCVEREQDNTRQTLSAKGGTKV
jgi:hypothetical protein